MVNLVSVFISKILFCYEYFVFNPTKDKVIEEIMRYTNVVFFEKKGLKVFRKKFGSH
jgi:hypothetical protein